MNSISYGPISTRRGNHFTERCGIEKGGFFEPLFDKSEREARAEDGTFKSRRM